MLVRICLAEIQYTNIFFLIILALNAAYFIKLITIQFRVTLLLIYRLEKNFCLFKFR